MQLTPAMIQEMGVLKNGKITIANNRLQLNRAAAASIIKQLGNELGITFNTTITGPTYVQLNKVGTNYTGKTKTPVVVKFSTTYEGQKISGNLKTHFNAKVAGTTLTLTVPITGSALGYNLTGKLTITCKR